MREEYMIERQGKRFVLYAGLLEEAHSRGLRSIETELLQVPTKENGEVAIVKAVIRTEEGKFGGIGDASPQNVNRAIAPHLIRMAETRAKRALSGTPSTSALPLSRSSAAKKRSSSLRGRRSVTGGPRRRTRKEEESCLRPGSSSTIWRHSSRTSSRMGSAASRRWSGSL